MNVTPTPIAETPSAIPACAFVAAGVPGNAPVLPTGPGDEATATAAEAPAVTAVARFWSAMGTPGRAAAVAAAVSAAVVGGVAQFRRAKRDRDAAAQAAGAEPVEFPLNHHQGDARVP
jgi:negative regulator of sigma E activity